MSRPRDPYTDLRAAIQERRAVLVAGSGLSIAATRGHPQASWGGLLKHGLAWLRDHDLISEAKARAHLSLMEDEDAGTHHFVAAAQDITRQMGGQASVHFREWLEHTVGALVAEDRAGLEELDALRAHGNLLATTNYDSLILGGDAALTPVTWGQYDEFLEAVRHKQTDKVLFLHGFWRKPDSVVLDWSSYERIARDDRYRADLSAFWHLSTWVYVGCGVNGLRDPDLGLLLDRYGGRLRTAGLWDYCLVRRDQYEEFQAHFDERNVNIIALSFGDAHDELPAYLGSLLAVRATPPSIAARDSAPPPTVSTRPAAPDLYAVPDYVGSHDFVGRESQLRDLDDWARAADPTTLLLFEAIGGSGKSMLTWKWVNDHAPVVRTDWAGRFWYSFYERGAVMADFCRHALAYTTGQPLEAFEMMRTPELAPALIDQLHAKPWLVVLDGLERVLVAYHRIDAAELPDEAADQPTDVILTREPTNPIRDEDGDLLRFLVAARPSKILVTSRLTPGILLNQAGQPIPGAKRQPLGGLRPDDAEAMFRASSVHGDSDHIQRYLTENCDNHPLVIGVLAGLVANYLPARGDFEAWVSNDGPKSGGRLNLGELDLAQRRNHILRAALDDLSATSWEVLSTLALLPASVDYETLTALSPFLSPEPKEVPEPKRPEETPLWQSSGDEQRKRVRRRYEAQLARRRDYERELVQWRQSSAAGDGAQRLADSVRDLEQRGLLQYDDVSRRHDLHPVVRAVASGTLRPDDLQRHGQRLVDHFTSASNASYERASTLEDVAPALNLVRTLLKLGRVREAITAFYGSGLSVVLHHNLEAHVETVALLRPFFRRDWSEVTTEDVGLDAALLSTVAGNALQELGDVDASLAAYGLSLETYLARDEWRGVSVSIRNIAECLREAHLAKALRLTILALDLASVIGENSHIFKSLLWLFDVHNRLGMWDEAAESWRRLDAMGRDWPRELYRQGEAELRFAVGQFFHSSLREEDLAVAASLAEEGHSRSVLRMVYRLRGMWRLEHRDWAQAAPSLHEAVRMARERRMVDEAADAGLLLAKFHLGLLTPDEARQEAMRVTAALDRPHRLLAMIWHELGDKDRAETEALAAYEEAWADGEPYVFRYELTKACELLGELRVLAPDLPPYDPDADDPLPWEADVRAAIGRLRAEKTEKDAEPRD